MGFKIECQIDQHTPMIHFQHDENGVCLRPSEVKPKLDRFLVALRGGAESVPSDWWIEYDRAKHQPVHEALNYKLRIEAVGEPEKSETIKNAEMTIDEWLNKGDYRYKPKIKGNSGLHGKGINDGYFGNQPKPPSKNAPEAIAQELKEIVNASFKETVFYKDGIKLTILCFVKELREEIKKQIALFFLLHNFGTRQSKGFGSFSVSSICGVRVKADPAASICEYYEKHVHGLPVFELIYSGEKRVDALERIRITYGFMKSGFNFRDTGDYYKGFALQYFYDTPSKFKNDKAFVKQKVLTGEYEPGHGGEFLARGDGYRFTRAMLGISGEVKWMKKSHNNNDHWNHRMPTITYKHDKPDRDPKKIERIPSPITFSVIGNRIFVLPYPIPTALFNQTFIIAKKDFGPSARRINTPTSSREFDFADFLNKFAAYFNDKEKPKGGDLGIEEANNYRLEPAKTLMLEKL